MGWGCGGTRGVVCPGRPVCDNIENWILWGPSHGPVWPSHAWPLHQHVFLCSSSSFYLFSMRSISLGICWKSVGLRRDPGFLQSTCSMSNKYRTLLIEILTTIEQQLHVSKPESQFCCDIPCTHENVEECCKNVVQTRQTLKSHTEHRPWFQKYNMAAPAGFNY